MQVSAGGFSTVVGYLKFVGRGHDLAATLVLLPVVCVVAACLLTALLFYARKTRSCGGRLKAKPKPPKTPTTEISYIQVAGAAGGDAVSRLSHWPLRQQPSPLLSCTLRYVTCVFL